MRRFQAFVYATAVYGALGGGLWMALHHLPKIKIAEEAASTQVTLVRAEEARPEATQAVNSQASPAPSEERRPEEEPQTPPVPEEAPPETPKEPEPKEAPPPEPPKPTPPAEAKPPEVSAPEPPTEEEPPPEPQKVETPEIATVAESQESTVVPTEPKLAPATPFDAAQSLALKRPLSEEELASCCPPETPKKSPVKKRVKKRKAPHKVAKRRSVKRSGRNSVRSRARQGGARNVNRLFAKIKRRIARNKSYPAVARRRRQQGSVRVSFTVTRSGSVRSIRVSGPRIFAASARSAVRRAFPIDVGAAAGSLPKRLSVVLNYRLH